MNTKELVELWRAYKKARTNKHGYITTKTMTDFMDYLEQAEDKVCEHNGERIRKHTGEDECMDCGALVLPKEDKPRYTCADCNAPLSYSPANGASRPEDIVNPCESCINKPKEDKPECDCDGCKMGERCVCGRRYCYGIYCKPTPQEPEYTLREELAELLVKPQRGEQYITLADAEWFIRNLLNNK